MIREKIIESLGDLLNAVTPSSPHPVNGRFRDNAIYRGVADTRWSMLTSLDRLGGIRPAHTKTHLEEHILRNFIRYSRPYLQQPVSNEWELLVIAQHHGLPTRLLDWSYSPLVAAHFATLEDNQGADRVVWKLDWMEIHKAFNLRQVALLVQDLDEILRQQLWDFIRAGNNRTKHFACVLEPPSLDSRIVAQSAAFTICSDTSRPIENFLIDSGLESTMTRFIIPSIKVSFIRDQLDLCSLDERRLLPGLDGVAAEMTRYYS